jgi:hypothetical protein
MIKGIATKNRDALMSSEIFEKHRYKLKLNSHKLLLGLIQSIDHDAKMFTEVGYDIQGLFKYLHLENRNDRYDVVRECFEDIVKNPLIVKTSEKKWWGAPWLSYEFDENQSQFVKIEFTPKIRPYLLDFQKFIHLKGRYITAFSSDYAITLYPVFRWVLEAYHGKHDLSIVRLKEVTFTDDEKEYPAYNVGASATKNFLYRVVGVKMDTKTKKIEIIKDSPLWEINEKSDLAVHVVGFVKSGKKYTGLKFHVVKKDAKQKVEVVHKVPDGNMAQVRIPLKDFYETLNGYNKRAKAANQKELNVHEYAEMGGYYIHSNFVHKKMSDTERKDAIKVRDAQVIIKQEKEQKRTWKTEGIKEVFARHRQTDLFEQIERETKKDL